jgi:hypothetical protein
MAMNAGSVTAQRGAEGSITVSGPNVNVVSTTWFTGSGLALALASAHFVSAVQGYGATVVTTLAGQTAYGDTHTALSNTALALAQGVAVQAAAYASAIIGHIAANAVVPATGLLDHGGNTCSGSTTVT